MYFDYKLSKVIVVKLQNVGYCANIQLCQMQFLQFAFIIF